MRVAARSACYDGSPDSDEAVNRAAALFRDEQATVLTVWQPFVALVARSTVGFGLAPSVPDPDEIDEARQKASDETAKKEVGASAIVMGSRGLSGIKSLLLGGVSHEVLQHADRTVVVVPSAEVARSRAREGPDGEDAS